MAKLSVLSWIGNAAARLCGSHGAVAQQAAAAACSRQTVYDHARKVQNALADAQRSGPTRAQLLDQLRCLRDENQQLWQWLDQTIDCPPEKRRQFAVTAAAMGLSLQQTLTLLAVLLPPALRPSRATLGRWVHQGAQRARRLLSVLDQACRCLVLSLSLDEIFFHRRPVLMGIEPHSLAWMIGQRAADRSGPTWCQALANWPQLTDVAADGGTGIELGLQLTAQKRQEQAAQAQGKRPAVPLHIRLDLFHIRREGERALRLEWSRAEAVWEQAEQTERDKKRFDRGGTDRRAFKKDVVAKAWASAEAAYREVEGKEAAWRRAVEALAVFRPDGRLTTRAWAEAQLRRAAAALPGARWNKVKRMLRDARSLTFLDRLHEELAQAEPRRQRRAELVAYWRWRREQRGQPEPGTSAAGVVGAVVEGWVGQRLGKKWAASYRRVAQVLRRVVRASSAVECVNSVVRMHQARHRNLSQELLDLKRLYWNCRPFVSGKRRKRCPYEHLGLRLPTYDPWTLLQMNPEELKQQLSSPRLAA